MTTAVIGVGNIGSRVARNLVTGSERVVLAARDQSSADSLAGELGGSRCTHSDLPLGGPLTEPSAPETTMTTTRRSPLNQSAASVVANLLPAGAHYVKTFGTLGADALGSAANREPERAVLFYATDDDTAAATAEALIRACGFDPVKAGGIEAAGRIETPGGDLHQNGLDGKLLTIDEARAAL